MACELNPAPYFIVRSRYDTNFYLLLSTWAGQSFETGNGAPFGEVVEELLMGVSVTVAASEVVLLSFK